MKSHRYLKLAVVTALLALPTSLSAGTRASEASAEAGRSESAIADGEYLGPPGLEEGFNPGRGGGLDRSDNGKHKGCYKDKEDNGKHKGCYKSRGAN